MGPFLHFSKSVFYSHYALFDMNLAFLWSLSIPIIPTHELNSRQVPLTSHILSKYPSSHTGLLPICFSQWLLTGLFGPSQTSWFI